MARISRNEVLVKDMGWREINRQLHSLHGASTAVGFHKNTPHDKKRKGGKVTAGNDSPDVPTIAAWMQFGTKAKTGGVKSPRRPFMTMAVEHYQEDLNSFRASLLKSIYEGKMTAKRALALLGQRHEDQIKRTITTGNFVPNAPSTIDAKGSSKPLINTSQMRQSVRHVETIAHV